MSKTQAPVGQISKTDLDIVANVLREKVMDTSSNRRAAACDRVESLLQQLAMKTISSIEMKRPGGRKS